MRSLNSFVGLRTITVAFFIFLYAPILVLVVLSFNAGDSTATWSGFGLQAYRTLAADGALRQAAGNSLIVACFATIGSTLVATLAAIALHGRRGAMEQITGSAITFPLLVPEIVTAVATLLALSVLAIPLGLATIMFAHTVFCLPFAFLPVKARLADMDGRLLDAAADLYATPFRAFRAVTLPLMVPGIVAGAMLAFITSIDNFVITYFVAGAGYTTLPVYIYGVVKVGVSPEINAISTVLLAVSVSLVTLSYFVGKLRRI
ncbi:ABC transporter permease [Burkholderia sp. MSh2]|nr:ABC transporter permease [Burkholderia sp. MSh2]KFG98118.1 ABC transporter permease [Burkholderia paludis]